MHKNRAARQNVINNVSEAGYEVVVHAFFSQRRAMWHVVIVACCSITFGGTISGITRKAKDFTPGSGSWRCPRVVNVLHRTSSMCSSKHSHSNVNTSSGMHRLLGNIDTYSADDTSLLFMAIKCSSLIIATPDVLYHWSSCHSLHASPPSEQLM